MGRQRFTAVGLVLALGWTSAFACDPPSDRSQLVGSYCPISPGQTETVNLGQSVMFSGLDQAGIGSAASVLERVLVRAPDGTYVPFGEPEGQVYGDMVELGEGCDILRTPTEEAAYQALVKKIFYTSKKGRVDRSRFSDAVAVYFDYQDTYIKLLEALEKAEEQNDQPLAQSLRDKRDLLLEDWEAIGLRSHWESALERFRDLDWKQEGFAVAEALVAYRQSEQEQFATNYLFDPPVDSWHKIEMWKQVMDLLGNTSFRLEVAVRRPWMSDWILLGECWTWALPSSDPRRRLIASGDPARSGVMPGRTEMIVLRAKPEDVSIASGTVNAAILDAVGINWLPPLPAGSAPP